MKKIIINIIYLPLILIGPALSQTFSPDIIVEDSIANQVSKSAPTLNVDKNGNIGILWSTLDLNKFDMRFVKSLDNGQSFDSIRIVETIPYYLGDEKWLTQLIQFDYLGNPLTFYLTDYSSSVPPIRINKSLDQGKTFSTNPYSNYVIYTIVGHTFLNDSISLLAIPDTFSLREIDIKKSIDSGISYSDLSFINMRPYSNMPYNINIIKCDNNDILCFWTGQHETTTVSNILCSRSVDEGLTFQSPIPLDSLYDGMNGISAICYQNYVFIVYFAGNYGGVKRILFKKSEDFGYSYSQAKLIHEFSSSPQTHPAPEARFNPNVGLCIVWGQGIIYFRYSKDLGESFDSTVTVAISPNYRGFNSMEISDSGDVYISSLVPRNYGHRDRIVINKTRLPLLTKIKNPGSPKISGYTLYQNYPNPFNIGTTISFNLPKRKYAELNIYDINGRLINTLISGELRDGQHKFNWRGLNSKGQEVSSGIYLYQLRTDDYSQSHKLILLK